VRRTICTTMLGVMCASVVFEVASAAPAADERGISYDLDIPAQNLNDALQAFALVSRHKLLYSSELVDGKTSPALKGRFTTEQAIVRLLSNTKLGYDITADGLILIRAAGDPSASKPRPASSGQPHDSDPVSREGTLPTTAQAASTPDNSLKSLELDEVVVTASKRSERLQDVPASVTAVSARALTDSGAVRFEDYAAKVPGLVLDNTSAAGGLSQLSLRGVTTGSGGSPTVGFYIDDAPFGSSKNAIMAPDLDPSDLARIEVLRGPQGTLYGGGSMGGLVKFVTQSPDFTEASGRVQVDGARVDGGGSGYGVRAAGNIPLGENVALRMSVFDRQDPGFINDAVDGARDVNRTRYDGGRAALAWRASDTWDVRLSGMIQQLDGRGTPTEDFDPATGKPLYGDLQQVRAPGTGRQTVTYQLYDVRVEGHLGWADLVSATSYGRQNADLNTDLTSLYEPLLNEALGLPNVGTALQGNSNLNKVSQELRLSSPADQRLAWQAGAFYTHERSTLQQELLTFDATTGGPLPVSLPTLITAEAPSTFQEAAVFADTTYRFTPRFDVMTGFRYSHNWQSSDQTVGGLLVGPASTVSLASSDGSWTYLVTPRFHLNDTSMAYLRVASGYRPGGPNNVVPGVPPSYKPDTVVNYEAGFKSDLFDRRLSVDVAVFLIDWNNVQIYQQSPLGISFYSNGGLASSRGAEGNFSWRPFAGLILEGNVSRIDATLGRSLPAPAVGADGDALPFTPHWSGEVSAEYESRLWGPWSGLGAVSYRYVGDRLSDFTQVDSYHRFQLPSYEVVDLRVGIHTDRLSLSAYVKNVGDARGEVNGILNGPVEAVAIIQPRTVGLSISTEF
jgi:iron complex outermembrane recepter protein